MSLVFEPWRRFSAFVDKSAHRRWLNQVADESLKTLQRGFSSTKTGRVYRKKGGGSYRASAPGEYPAKPTGALAASASKEVSDTEATIGTSKFYAKFLRNGTSKMARRKMSDTAMTETFPKVRYGLAGSVRWRRG